jgi:hypothetical protein
MVFAYEEDESIGQDEPLDRRHGLEKGFWAQEKGRESQKNNGKKSTLCHDENSFFKASAT